MKAGGILGTNLAEGDGPSYREVRERETAGLARLPPRIQIGVQQNR
jgi:hypothetical protein